MATSTIDGIPTPDLDGIAQQAQVLQPYVLQTPVVERTDFDGLGDTRLNFKFELLQVSGTFKARGAFSNLLALTDAQRQAGVTCVSAGNHAVAVAYAAKKLGIRAKVVMIKTASPARVALVHRYGAELILADDGVQAFERVRQLEQEEGLFFVHPFNGYHTVLGTATLGYEWANQSPELDALILPIGGGGLAAGVSTAFKLVQPNCRIFGVEPETSDAMGRSVAQGQPIKMGPMQTIADSLMAPHTEAYSYELCRRNIDQLLTVTDDEIRLAALALFQELKLATEPACAVATAALMGPLKTQLHGKRVGILLCGTNTDPATFAKHLDAAQALSQ